MTAAIPRHNQRPAAPCLIVERPNRASIETHIANTVLRGTVKIALATLTRGPYQFERMVQLGRLADPLAAMLITAPAGTRRAPIRLGKFRAEWLWHTNTNDPRQQQDSALLYFHGGAYLLGGLNTHRRLVAKIARASQMPAFNVDYRQLPKAHFTQTLNDAIESYRYLLEQGFPAERIIVSGDSAGGGLAFRLALATRDHGLPMPGGISVISPWADFDSTTRNAHPNHNHDAYLPTRSIDTISQHGLTLGGQLDPTWSPINHDFTGLPPVLIQVGSTECLLPDAQTLAQRCASAHIPTRLQIWDHAPHVHHIASDLLNDARAAINHIGKFHQTLITNKTRPQTNTHHHQPTTPHPNQQRAS
jgi:acetyl esterase/lipase